MNVISTTDSDKTVIQKFWLILVVPEQVRHFRQNEDTSCENKPPSELDHIHSKAAAEKRE